MLLKPNLKIRRYLIRVTITRGRFSTNVIKELDIAVFTYKKPKVTDAPIKMDVS
jgi:hypothetical protein